MISVCSLSDRVEINGLSWPRMKEYCKKYGYNYVTRTEAILKDRHISWSKLPLIIELLDSGSETVLWVDDDAIITNMEIKIEEFTLKDGTNILISQDRDGEIFNCGIIIAKQGSQKILQEIIDSVSETNRYDHPWEQNATMSLYRNNQHIRDAISIIAPGILQGFYRYYSNEPVEFKWNPSTFIAHCAGMPTETRIYYMKELLDRMITIFDNRNDMIKYYSNQINNPKLLEIGVFKGDFLDYIIKNCVIDSIDAVDLFEGEIGSGDVDGNNFIWYDIGKSYLELSEKYKNNINIHLHKSDSSTYLQNQLDNTYDIIYIDADHSYDGVKKDLLNSFNKIKNGGYIMGHDYEMNMNKAMTIYNFGVKQAVDEFCDNYKQNILSKALDGCVSYCIQINK
jgi:hypothetical protein